MNKTHNAHKTHKTHKTFQDIPLDVIQTIGLLTHSTTSYLNLALSCKQNSKILTNIGKRVKALRWFTTITIDKYGSKSWYINGKYHREDGPAYIGSNGFKAWFINGNIIKRNSRKRVFISNVMEPSSGTLMENS